MTLRPVREVAQGRWRGILPSLGIDARMLSGKQGPCPLCGGKTRFRFDDKEGRGTWICNSTSCGAGDGVALVMAKNGWDFREAARRIEEIAGEAPTAAPKPQQTDEQKRAAMKRMWADAVPVVMGDPVDLYLRSRLGDVVIPATIRTLARCRYPDGTHHPAMIAKMAAADGTPVMLHRTYLKRDGLKADVDQPRMTMPGQMPDGSAVRLGRKRPPRTAGAGYRDEGRSHAAWARLSDRRFAFQVQGSSSSRRLAG